MPRPRRIQTPGLLRHVLSRGNGRMCIFLDDGDYRQFVYLLGEVCENFAVECWSYTVMPNHFHTALRPQKPNISEALRHLDGEYGKWWNRRHGKVGHTFQGRFKAQIVQHEQYLLTLLRYIALNPVRAGLVARPEDWRWGSYPALAGLISPPPFLYEASLLAAFGGADLAVARDRFTRYVLGENPSPELEDRLRSNERILGDADFKKEVRMRVDAEREQPAAEPEEMEPV